jgi:hypothetical protein
VKEFLVTTFLALGIIFVANNYLVQETASITEAIMTPEPMCENYAEIADFEKPIPVVWTAMLDGCLVSCEGASFTRVPRDEKHPRFAGYYPGGAQADLRHAGHTLKITGNWVGIGADHFVTVFDNKCVPIVHINKVEMEGSSQ